MFETGVYQFLGRVTEKNKIQKTWTGEAKGSSAVCCLWAVLQKCSHRQRSPLITRRQNHSRGTQEEKAKGIEDGADKIDSLKADHPKRKDKMLKNWWGMIQCCWMVKWKIKGFCWDLLTIIVTSLWWVGSPGSSWLSNPIRFTIGNAHTTCVANLRWGCRDVTWLDTKSCRGVGGYSLLRPR